MPRQTAEDVVDDVVGRFLDEPEADTTEQDTTADEATGGEEPDEGSDEGDLDGAEDTTRGADSKGGKGDGANKQQPGKKGPQDRQAGPGAQDLVDPRTGQILAKAGKDRRVWENAAGYVRNQFQQVLQKVDGRVRELQGKVSAYEQNNRVAAELQVTQAETEAGIKLVAAFKKDPVATVQYLLAQAKAKGHNIDLGEGSVAGIDAAAVSRMMDAKLAPMMSEYQNRERVTQAYQEAETELGEFYSRYPTARANEDEINRLLQKFPDLTLETAYLRLQLWATQNGLDPNQSILRQVQARTGQQQQQQQPGNPGRRPMPNGRAAPGVAAINGKGNGAVRIAHEDTSYRDIVKEAMREAGLQVN